ncbi:hypothetical protein LV779_12045 [Streptomyces thinghirensis]|nr:hypothetical protein [Streptomyces thinghirensis]
MTGTGGVGKSRLAARAAAGCAPRDGVAGGTGAGARRGVRRLRGRGGAGADRPHHPAAARGAASRTLPSGSCSRSSTGSSTWWTPVPR